MQYIDLPLDFQDIIQYDNIKSVDCRLLGYSYNTVNDNVKLSISTIDKNIQDLDNWELIGNALKLTNSHEVDIKNIKQDLENLKKQLNKPKKINSINTKDTEIIAGFTNSVKIDETGLSTSEIGNDDCKLIFSHGALGITHSGNQDFEPIITAKDGILPKFLSNSVNVQIDKNSIDNNQNTDKNNDNDDKKTTTPTFIKSPPIRYMDLTCKLIRNEKNQVEKIQYINSVGEIEYIETLIRDDKGKVVEITKEHINAETEITKLIRDEKTNKVTDVIVEYENDNEDYEFGGML